MKKKLVVLLAVVMMFAFSASAYAATFSDVSERPVVEQDAIKKAVALGIIEGYEDGTFGPDKTITRAEFAKIAVTAAGAKETATMLEANASAFKDVRANSWYTGWINAAESLGIFKGDTNGNFRPNDTISNQEAITVLLRLLGYNDNLTGSWPVNYVTKANQIGIMDDVSIVASAAAKRGDIVVMLGEALDTAIVTYDKDTNEFVYKQTTKSGSTYITLLDDSFEGSFIEVDDFATINQVRNVADKTLNWNVAGRIANLAKDTNDNKVGKDNFDGNVIVDENTAVSHNAEGLFDLEHHQGKVYYVTEGDRKYARFIEVESYIQTVTDKVEQNGDNKVKVLSTNYNAVKDPTLTDDVEKDWKNTNYSMYFNDDDQVYYVASDRDFEDKAYYVKSMTTASARLVGSKTKTVNMNDADTLVYADGKFVAPSDLQVGDAIREIKEGELYVKVTDQSGDFTRTEVGTLKDGDDIKWYQHKATIGGKKYVFVNDPNQKADEDVDGIVTLNPQFYEEDLEQSDVTSEDVYNNNVKYLLNKDNTIAAIIVDETSTGTTLYGVVVDGGGNGSWGKSMSTITLFTQEGYTVTYDLSKDCKGKPQNTEMVQKYMGQPVAYKLNADGAIKTISGGWNAEDANGNDAYKDGKLVGSAWTNMLDGGNTEIQVKNNAYLVTEPVKAADGTSTGTRLSASLASNVVIFEVGEDENELDVSLVTRSALLSGGDFEPETVDDVKMLTTDGYKFLPVQAYAKYISNTNHSIKAFAYTSSHSSTKYYGVIKAWKFTDADHAGFMSNGEDDFAITLEGDDKVYDLGDVLNGAKPGAGHFIVYTLSGDEIDILASYKKTDGLTNLAKLVSGFNDGWIYFKDPVVLIDYMDEFHNDDENYGDEANIDGNNVYVNRVMTDANTVVYVLDSNTGKYREGALSDISRNSYAYVPFINDDGYAGAVLVDEYVTNRDYDEDDKTSSKATFKKDIKLTVKDKDGDTVRFHDFEVGTVKDKTSAITFTVENNGSDKVKDIEVKLNATWLDADIVDIDETKSGVFECTIKKADVTLKDGENVIAVNVIIK